MDDRRDDWGRNAEPPAVAKRPRDNPHHGPRKTLVLWGVLIILFMLSYGFFNS